jgi:hypothetical protein
MPHSISLNPWSFEGLLLSESMTLGGMVEQAAGLGFDSIDIGDLWMNLSPNPDLARLRELRSMTRGNDLTVSSCWFWIDLLAGLAICGDKRAVAESLRGYFAICEYLGAPFITLQNGNPAPGVSHQQAHDALLDLYQDLEKMAVDHNVVVALEAPRSPAPFNSPQGTLRLVREYGSPWLTVTPDFEAWRIPREGMPPLRYPENPGATRFEALAVAEFEACLPLAPFIHAKFLEFDDSGTDPNFPLEDIFRAIRESDRDHVICVEYEGWIPDLHPERDAVSETAKAIELIRHHLRPVDAQGAQVALHR